MKSGQALVILLVFMVVATTVTFAAVGLTVSGSQSSTRQELGAEVYTIAESGVENGLIRLLRDPDYPGETLTVGNGTATIVVDTVGNTSTITATGRVDNFVRVVRVTTVTSGGVLTVSSWQEIFP
jgi:hypothetical protein